MFGVKIDIADKYQASLELWNFVNAYAIPLVDRLSYDIYCYEDVMLNGVRYNDIGIAGSNDDIMAKGKYGKYLILFHSEDGVVYSDFYICNE